MVKTQVAVSPAATAAFLSAGTTHNQCAGPEIRHTQESEHVAGLQGAGVLPGPVQGGDSHKLQDGTESAPPSGSPR
jgi:hypothetical protein